MSGNVKQFVDFSTNTNNDTGENNSTSIQPMVDGEGVTGAVLARPSESLRQRTEAVRDVMADILYLRDSDRNFVVFCLGGITWPGSTTNSASGIPVLTNTLWLIPMLTSGAVQIGVPPVASSLGVLHLKRSSDSTNAISVTSQRRSYAAGDQISVTVSSGVSFSCVLDAESGFRRTIKIVATASTTLGTVISALNGLTPPAPDNAQLVVAALEGGAASGDFILRPQARQYVSGNYDGEAHQIGVSTMSGFFASNPSQALAEGDTLCIRYDTVTDLSSIGGRRQSLIENSNTAVPSGSLFNSRVHPEFLTNAIPVCKVLNNTLVFGTGAEIAAGSTSASLSGHQANDISYAGGPAWADSTTNPAATVEAQLDKIVTDLAGSSGTAKIMGSAVGGDLSANTLALQITDLVTNWFKNSRTNTVTAAQIFQNLVTVNGLVSGGDVLVGNQLLAFTDFTYTANATTDQLTKTTHGLQTGDGPVRTSNSGGALPSPLLAATDYYVIRDDANNFRMATTRANSLAGTSINLTTAGSGTNTLNHQAGTTRVNDAEVTRTLTVDGTLIVNGSAKIAATYTYTGSSGVEQVPDITKVTRSGARMTVLSGSTRTGSNGIIFPLILPVGFVINKVTLSYNKAVDAAQVTLSVGVDDLDVTGPNGVATLINDVSGNPSTGFINASSGLLAVNGAGHPLGTTGSMTIRADRTYWLLLEVIASAGNTVVYGITVST